MEWGRGCIMTKTKDEELLKNQEMRQELMNQVEVLNKIKELITLPNTDILTTKMVSEYYEVDFSVIEKAIQRNRKELEQNGFKKMTYGELKELISNSDIMSELRLSKQGSNIFSARAVLNMGMLLRDSKIAIKVREELLNGFEKLSTKQKQKELILKETCYMQ